MQVFISWSGEQALAVAVALRAWLPEVLADKVVPFVSQEDIDKGSRGLDRIANELEESSFGVVVVTPGNQESTWINFEAGALGKSVTSGRVAPLLVGLTDADLAGPLRQFQNSAADDKEALRALVQSINKTLSSDALPSKTVNDLFDLHWRDLADQIALALQLNNPPIPATRRPEDLLDEVLTTVRSLQREVSKLRRAVDLIDKNLPGQGLRHWPITSTSDRLKEWTRLAKLFPGGGQLDLMFASLLDHESYTIAPTSDGYMVSILNDTPPKLSPLFDDLRAIAHDQEIVIRVVTQAGLGLKFDPDGNLENFLAAGDPDGDRLQDESSEGEIR